MTLSRETILKRFGDIWPVHHRGFTSLLIECRRAFDGDMDQLVILSVIGERMLTQDRSRGLTYSEFREGKRGAGISRRINAQSIAGYTGIPRETVRRKINGLIDRGWVKKDDHGMLEVSLDATVDLAPATQITFDYFISLGNALITIALEAHEISPPGHAPSPFD